MPSELPRIAVRVSKRQYEIISRLASLQGRSRGAVVVDLVEAVEPMLERTAVILERAKSAPQSVKAGLRALAGEAEKQAMRSAEVEIGKLDLFLGALGPEVSDEGEGRPAATNAQRRRGRADPRPSNHGGQVAKKARKMGRTGVDKVVKGKRR